MSGEGGAANANTGPVGTDSGSTEPGNTGPGASAVQLPKGLTPIDPQQATEFWVVRHGESTWNVQGRYQGQTDVPLSPQGRLQAAILAERLTGQGFAGVYSSDLARALDTARAVSDRLEGQPEVQIEGGLREIDVGALGGKDIPEIAAEFPDFLSRLRADPWTTRRPGGESMQDLSRRVGRTFSELRARHPGGRVLIFTHGGVVRVAVGLALGSVDMMDGADTGGTDTGGAAADSGVAACARPGGPAPGIPQQAWARLSVTNTSLTRVLLSPQGGTLLGFNDAAHLETLLEATEADDAL